MSNDETITAKWILKKDIFPEPHHCSIYWICSNCGRIGAWGREYCPQCNAKMVNYDEAKAEYCKLSGNSFYIE